MKIGGDAPKAPNPIDTARAQSAGDVSTALAQTLLNQTNQVTPYGSLSYKQSGTTKYRDPLLDKDVTIPMFTATTQLSPAQQALLAQEQEFDQKYNTLALQQTDKIGNILNTPFEYDMGDYETFAGDLYGKLNDEANQRNLDMLDTKLKNARRFLMDGDKVKVTVMFRGRELVHREIGRKQLDRVTEMLGGLANVENPPRMEGRFLSMILVPNREGVAEAKKLEEKAAKAAVEASEASG